MVSTRSGRDTALARALQLSKITAAQDPTRPMSVLAPLSKKESRVRKTRELRASPSSKRKSGPRKKLSAISSRKTNQRVRVTANLLKTSSGTHKATTTEVLVRKTDNTTRKSLKRKTVEYTERETDAARTLQVVIKTGEYRATAFKLPGVGSKKKVYPRGFFSNNIDWKVGHQPFLVWKGVDADVYYKTFYTLRDFYKRDDEEQLTLNLTDNPITPGHAYAGDRHRFHALIEPILSCATSNNNQKLASANLFRTLTYREGRISKISPNYHKLCQMTEKEIQDIIRQSGRFRDNAKRFKALFHEITAENIKRQGLGADEADRIHKEAMEAEDWTNGLLSLDFMVGMAMQEIFDTLVKHHGIACKTAACIMCFTFGFAVFAVDTHVFRLCQWLGWVPLGCSRDDAFKFLTLVIPPELHRDLHQGFWHHGQLCYRCNDKTWRKVNDPQWKKTICPLEQLGINRFHNWERKQHTGKEREITPRNVDKELPEKKTEKSKDLNKMVTVWLKTDRDVSDAQAAGYDIMQTEIDDAFGANPELSNIKKELKKFLYITESKRIAFKEFQKAKAPKKVVKVQTRTTKKQKVTIMEDIEVMTEEIEES